MTKTLFKISSLVIAVIIAVSSLSFNAFAYWPKAYNINNLSVTGITYDAERNESTISFDIDEIMSVCKNNDGIYLGCYKAFSDNETFGYITESENGHVKFRVYDASINPYDYYTVEIMNWTFESADGTLTNEPYTSARIPGYEILQQKRPAMFGFINVLRNIFSLIIH
jgi:hypothetical protein